MAKKSRERVEIERRIAELNERAESCKVAAEKFTASAEEAMDKAIEFRAILDAAQAKTPEVDGSEPEAETPEVH